jgi:hypothetical protein
MRFPLPHSTFFVDEFNIVFTKNGIHSQVDVVIVDPMRVDLLPQSCATQRFVAFNMIQAKGKNYCDQHPID